MPTVVYLATESGVWKLEKDENRWSIKERFLEDQRFTSIAVAGNTILAGTRSGIYCSEDGSATWQKPDDATKDLHVRWMAFHDSGRYTAFVGAEPASIYVSTSDNPTWQERPEVSRLRDIHGWYLPYSDGAGCVRGFSFHQQRMYAAVEVGGVLRSDNGGIFWQLVPGSSGNPSLGVRQTDGMIHPDVHSIYTHPSSPDLVCAPTGGGFYLSSDGGQSWKLLYDCYCRAAWWDPDDPDHLLLGPAVGVDRQGRVEETHDRGRTWTPASQGMQTPWPRHMVERFLPVNGEILAVLSNGELWSSKISPFEWSQVEIGGHVNAAAA